MQAIGFYIALPFLYLISVLPRFMLYGLSDFLFLVVYFMLGYRKKVVTENLQRSFPQKTEKEIKKIRRRFYRYFCDLVLETMRTLTVTEKKMKQLCSFHPSALELFEHYSREKKSLILVMGHWGNWEWAGNSFSLLRRHQLYVIYHPLHNKYFNNFIIKMRTRFGTRLIPMRETLRQMLKARGELNATAFIGDQTPPPESAFWTTFLNQDTPVFNGTEKISCKLNYPLIYVGVKRTRRGYYEVRAECLCENPAGTREGEITEMHTRRLEKDIREMPEIWLWSHRRWKHKRPEVN